MPKLYAALSRGCLHLRDGHLLDQTCLALIVRHPKNAYTATEKQHPLRLWQLTCWLGMQNNLQFRKL
jgi:hypothetical protein